MLEQNLENLTKKLQEQNIRSEVIKNYLKEYLQIIILDFLYSSKYKDLIFTGGSCLRICYGLNRLSEDLDLDTEKSINKNRLAQDLKKYFLEKLQYKNLEISIKGQNKKIYLKFPVLYGLNLAKQSESNKLYVKLEIEKILSKKFKTEKTPIIRDEFSFFVKNYDLPTLMAGKITAVLKRSFFKGKGDKITFKGRDYYDLIWYLQKDVKPNMVYIKDLNKISSFKKLFQELDKKIKAINLTYLKQDIENLFESKSFVEDFVKNFKNIYARYKKQYLAQ